MVDHAYDAWNRWIGRDVDTDGDGTIDEQTVFIHDGGQTVLQFDKSGAGDLAAADLSHRYMWGPVVDMLLADEQVDDLFSAANNETLWALTDNLGSVKDVVDSNGTQRLHREFDSFGNTVSEEHYDENGLVVTEGNAGHVTVVFQYTGKLFEIYTGLQNNWNRWYDARVGKWVSQDPIGFAAGDANLSRYVGNDASTLRDPDGLMPFGGGTGLPGMPSSPDFGPIRDKPNWAFGVGPLHHQQTEMTVTYPGNLGFHEGLLIYEEIFNSMIKFEHFNGGCNWVATIRRDKYRKRLYFDPKPFGSQAQNLVNDYEHAVSYEIWQDSKTIQATTLGFHGLVGRRRWSISPKFSQGTWTFTIKTEGYERPRGHRNQLGFWCVGDEMQSKVWELYFENMAVWLRGNGATVGKPASISESIGDYPNPWGPNAPRVPIGGGKLPAIP